MLAWSRTVQGLVGETSTLLPNWEKNVLLTQLEVELCKSRWQEQQGELLPASAQSTASALIKGWAYTLRCARHSLGS